MASFGQSQSNCRKFGRLRKALLGTLAAATFVGGTCVVAINVQAQSDPGNPSNFDPNKKKSRITQQELGRLRMLEIQSGAFREAHKDPGSQQLVGPPLSDREKVMHAMNRLAFGPKQGDVEKTLLEGGMTETVIGGAFVAILEDVVGLVDFFETMLALLVPRITVRVMLHRKFAEGCLQLNLGGGAGNAENFIIIALGHSYSAPDSRRRKSRT